MIEDVDKMQNVERVLVDAADKYFDQINPASSNGQLLIQAVNCPGTSKFIVNALKNIEKLGNFFSDDKKLNTWFDKQIRIRKIEAPDSPADKQRWLALMSILSSKRKGFSCGNVVIVPDYLPDNSKELEEYESIYGIAVIEDILRQRKALNR